MKRVLIQDDDRDLFSVPLQPTVYQYYSENKKEIHRMVKQQRAGFWIQFVTSFRSFITNFWMYGHASPEINEEAFVDMLKLLTTENSFTGFISLIESIKRLYTCVGSLGVFSMPVTAQQMSGFSKPFVTFPIYSRFVNSVVVMYLRWKHAPRVRARTPPAEWTPPAHWSQPNGRGPSSYERYLYDRWGNELHSLIRVEKDLMKFFNPQEIDDTSNASSSTSQKRMGTNYNTSPRRNQKRSRRDANRSGNVRQKQKEETVPPTTTGNNGKRNDTFREKKNSESNVLSKSTARKENKEKSPLPADKEVASNKDATNETANDRSFRYDRLFNFSKKSTTTQNETSEDNDKSDGNRKKETVRQCKEKEFTTNADETKNAGGKDFFRYDRLFSFSTRKQNLPASSENVSTLDSSSSSSNADDLHDSEYDGFSGFSRDFFGGPFQRGNYGKIMPQPVWNFLMHKCSNCNILEKSPGMYKACKFCVQHRERAPNVYCGEHCASAHWMRQHCADHFPYPGMM
ncbi:uncharacterized protein LOC110834226 isoform X2 [Zootermopsis nevadensis]|uniref:uncharacterized protein LOC110834226 isoform X2 n=1 Tax=Zootermopsis nevadensis TaxID=136037 RepID=UPI000B8E626D|nr:uncharacterized protein LOC110834226 isoform X2 [Zootermopsis nevadensis]